MREQLLKWHTGRYKKLGIDYKIKYRDQYEM